ncbi:pyrroline-5-carboxylate reductase [Clostridium sp. cel8]|uniref:pyrroline-5-carboxylate reductase n=1 Tax=Clostridium sp. cel8 TaxID=2663123 RepID=UPI0015F3F5AC|nr:pyrroline-5-carboxylate reductase [Clostridium sp. cel8]MBA5851124.1 pyrroline-5-carboxylate reductase [Clostridium sp. cel8]
MNKKLGLIGCGNMAQAIIGGVINSSTLKPDEVIASNPSNGKLENTKAKYNIETTNNNLEVAKTSDLIILSVKPNKYKDVIEEIKNCISSHTIIITIAAGISIDNIKSLFGKDVKVARVMPNTPAQVGEGMSAICFSENITDEDKKKVIEIFNSCGKSEIIDENLMDTVTGISGSSPAFVYMFIEAMADAAVLQGMTRKSAYKFAAQAVLGSAKMVLESGLHPGELKDNVCSPSGTTIQGVFSLENSGFRSAVMNAINDTIEKSKEMGKN